MTIRDWRGCGRLAALLCVVWATRAQAQVLRGASDSPASVDKDRLVIRFPLPYELQHAPSPPVTGYFVWRITVPTRLPFSVVVTSDTALHSAVPEEVLRASTVRLCANPLVESARACTKPINASLAIAGDHFRVIINDTALVARVRREGPAVYTRYVVYPGGRYLLTQHGFSY